MFTNSLRNAFFKPSFHTPLLKLRTLCTNTTDALLSVNHIDKGCYQKLLHTNFSDLNDNTNKLQVQSGRNVQVQSDKNTKLMPAEEENELIFQENNHVIVGDENNLYALSPVTDENCAANLENCENSGKLIHVSKSSSIDKNKFRNVVKNNQTNVLESKEKDSENIPFENGIEYNNDNNLTLSNPVNCDKPILHTNNLKGTNEGSSDVSIDDPYFSSCKGIQKEKDPANKSDNFKSLSSSVELKESNSKLNNSGDICKVIDQSMKSQTESLNAAKLHNRNYNSNNLINYDNKKVPKLYEKLDNSSKGEICKENNENSKRNLQHNNLLETIQKKLENQCTKSLTRETSDSNTGFTKNDLIALETENNSGKPIRYIQSDNSILKYFSNSCELNEKLYKVQGDLEFHMKLEKGDCTDNNVLQDVATKNKMHNFEESKRKIYNKINHEQNDVTVDNYLRNLSQHIDTLDTKTCSTQQMCKAVDNNVQSNETNILIHCSKLNDTSIYQKQVDNSCCKQEQASINSNESNNEKKKLMYTNTGEEQNSVRDKLKNCKIKNFKNFGDDNLSNSIYLALKEGYHTAVNGNNGIKQSEINKGHKKQNKRTISYTSTNNVRDFNKEKTKCYLKNEKMDKKQQNIKTISNASISIVRNFNRETKYNSKNKQINNKEENIRIISNALTNKARNINTEINNNLKNQVLRTETKNKSNDVLNSLRDEIIKSTTTQTENVLHLLECLANDALENTNYFYKVKIDSDLEPEKQVCKTHMPSNSETITYSVDNNNLEIINKVSIISNFDMIEKRNKICLTHVEKVLIMYMKKIIESTDVQMSDDQLLNISKNVSKIKIKANEKSDDKNVCDLIIKKDVIADIILQKISDSSNLDDYSLHFIDSDMCNKLIDDVFDCKCKTQVESQFSNSKFARRK